MTPEETLRRDIDTLLESHRLTWLELSTETDRERRKHLIGQAECYVAELKKLVLGPGENA